MSSIEFDELLACESYQIRRRFSKVLHITFRIEGPQQRPLALARALHTPGDGVAVTDLGGSREHLRIKTGVVRGVSSRCAVLAPEDVEPLGWIEGAPIERPEHRTISGPSGNPVATIREVEGFWGNFESVLLVVDVVANYIGTRRFQILDGDRILGEVKKSGHRFSVHRVQPTWDPLGPRLALGAALVLAFGTIW